MKRHIAPATIMGFLSLVCWIPIYTILYLESAGDTRTYIDLPPQFYVAPWIMYSLVLSCLFLSIGGLILEFVRFAKSSSQKQSSHTHFTWPLIALCAFIVLGASSIKARDPRDRAFHICINNLRQIDAAKQMWGMEHHKTGEDIPTETDLIPYLSRGNTTNPDLPHCPLGGAYQINALKGPPTCSFTLTLTNPPPGHWVTNHVLPY